MEGMHTAGEDVMGVTAKQVFAYMQHSLLVLHSVLLLVCPHVVCPLLQQNGYRVV